MIRSPFFVPNFLFIFRLSVCLSFLLLTQIISIASPKLKKRYRSFTASS